MNTADPVWQSRYIETSKTAGTVTIRIAIRELPDNAKSTRKTY